MFLQELERRLAELPGALAVGAASSGPFTNSDRGANITVEGYHARQDEDMECAVDAVSPGFFPTLRIPLLVGRDFTEADGSDAPKVAIVNEQFSRFFFPGGNPVGRHLAFGAGDVKLNIEIVGVVRDSYHLDLREKVAKFIYVPYFQDSQSGSMHYYIRTGANPLTFTGYIRRTVADIDSNVPLNEVGTLTKQISRIRVRRPVGGVVGLCIRGSRCLPRGHWTVWVDLLYGGAAHQRDRITHGAGGFAPRSPLAHPSQESGVGPLGGGARDRAGDCLHAPGLQFALRPQRHQPARLCGRHRVAGGGRSPGELHPGATGDEGGSHGGAAVRIKPSVISFRGPEQ